MTPQNDPSKKPEQKKPVQRRQRLPNPGHHAEVGKDRKLMRTQELYLWQNRPFVDQLIDTGASMKSIVDYCRGKGFNTTDKLVQRYRQMRKDAITYKGFATLDDFGPDRPNYKNMKRLDDREKERLMEAHLAEEAESRLHVSDKTRQTDDGRFQTTKSQQVNNVARKRMKEYKKDKRVIMSDLQFLDVMIQKGVETLVQMPSIDPGKALKAIELKYKLTQGSHGGLTMYGMEEIRLRESARENAMAEVIMEFVPEDQREKLLERLEFTTEEFYKAHGLGEVYQQQTASDIESQLEAEGLEPEEDDDYYNGPPDDDAEEAGGAS